MTSEVKTPLILGLTGSIGMGKSTTAAMFADFGLPVYDADAEVHALYTKGGAAVEPLGDAFPTSIVDGAVDRDALRKLVLGQPEALKRLESIVHPLVGMTQLAFRQKAVEAESDIAVLDIPLLFETGGDARCDMVAVVTAPKIVQKARVLARPGMTESDLEGILTKQMPDSEKRARADVIINTGLDLEHARQQVKALVDAIRRSRA